MTPLASMTALVADDESHVRLFVKTALQSMGMRVVAEATDGADAVARYQEHRPDVVFLDFNMPRMTGREALIAIRREFPDAFVIMLTSVAAGTEVEACLAAGAANYLRKDTPLAELKKEILSTCAEWASGGETA